MFKRNIVKLLFVLLVALGAGFVFKTEVKAELLQVLPKAEEGWTRYDDTDKLIKYYGKHNDKNDWITYKNQSGYYMGTKTCSSITGATCKFTVNAKKFRIIGEIQQRSKPYDYTNLHDVYIEGRHVKPLVTYNSNLKVNNVVVYEYEFENPGVHNVEIVVNNSIKSAEKDTIAIDAIDVLGTLDDEVKHFGKTFPVLVIEDPKYNYSVGAQYFKISGYALNISGVKNVNAILDGNTTFKGSLGLKRNDVETLKTIYPAFNNIDKSGYKIDCNLSGVAAGFHKLSIIATGVNNKTIEKVLFLRVTVDYDGFKNVEVIENKQPLYRYLNNNGDHMYSINPDKVDFASGYGIENGGQPIGYAYALQEANTVPLYKYYSNSIGDHFYTIDKNELGNGNAAYTYEGIECYVYNKQVEGTVGLYRYYNVYNGDHLYTVGTRELGNGAYGYILEKGGKPEGYVRLS